MIQFEQLRRLPVDLSAIGLAQSSEAAAYFCTPVGAQIIGWEGCDGIHYCFVEGFGETVFAVNPMPCGDENVYPLAKTLHDFLRLILAAGSAVALEQIAHWSQEQFDAFVEQDRQTSYPEQNAALRALVNDLSLTPMEQPFAYVKTLQAQFDSSALLFSAEYYDCKGLAQPTPQQGTDMDS